MRAFVPAYEIKTAANLRSALDVLADDTGVWQPFAGGTDLMVLLEAGKLAHKKYLNIWNLDELRGIQVSDDFVAIGALTTYTQIQAHDILLNEFPMLCRAASETGGLAIQNRGTLGGNIVNASPAADSPPALLSYDAELELVSSDNVRRIAYKDFHTGYKQMNRRADELLARILLPRRNKNVQHYYRKVGTRKAQAISKVCFAATAVIEAGRVAEIRIALGSVAPVPLRCGRSENVLQGSILNNALIDTAVNELGAEITPISDIRSTRDYRLRVAQNLLSDFLKNLQ
jgi:CO/xanthine dehydrogenase FAD-binding subunit